MSLSVPHLPPKSAAMAISLAAAPLRILRSVTTTLLIGSLQAYKLTISPMLGSRCRFYPSCSVYAQKSIQRFGPLKGSWLTAARLARCGPWHPGGVDEVPCATDSLHSCDSEPCTTNTLINTTTYMPTDTPPHPPTYTAAVNRNRA